jgi:cytochrome c-type biogenesis protein CcmF
VRLAPGDTHRLGDCLLVFDSLSKGSGPNYEAQVGRFTLTCGGAAPQALVSEKRMYVGSGMPMTESAIRWGLTRDIYVALGTASGPEKVGAWSVRVQLKPFIRWIWIGVLLMAVGSLCAAGARRLRRAAQPGREPAAALPAVPALEVQT